MGTYLIQGLPFKKVWFRALFGGLLLLGKKCKFQDQFDNKEWVFWSILFLDNLRFDWFWNFLDYGFQALSDNLSVCFMNPKFLICLIILIYVEEALLSVKLVN